eukprot:NODE_1246_length_2548_cov_10.465097.p1 GENE.NODE_1246_length_2548_cov_10.465097~~NODE_1246_length_2548_cov_10.465097.p1  ORF type:complete len:709 (-),score=233.86 NODE_1246_length_2548_cov_10.465097:330-2456(-)
MVLALLWLVALSPAVVEAASHEGTAHQREDAITNPIRKVVNMLQLMQKKVTAEGEKEKQLFENFKCYCSTNGGNLDATVAEANSKIPQVEAAITEGESQKAQLEEDLKQHRASREAAKTSMTEATAIREKDAAAYAKLKADLDANIKALMQALAALSKGVSGGFLQTRMAQTLQRLVLAKQDMADFDRQAVLSFLSGSQGAGYAPKSGEVIGILKQLGDDMNASAMDANSKEEKAIKIYKDLIAAKTKEVGALTTAVEDKVQRTGDLAVKIVNMKDDLENTQQALSEDEKFLSDLKDSCGKKESEWEERSKTRTEELAAIAETITILNDDDALQLFKKTLPSPSASFIQTSKLSARALGLIRAAQSKETQVRPQLDFIALALQGNQIGFEKVLAMIDKMIATLKTEQEDDDAKKASCGVKLDEAEDKSKGLTNSISDTETAMAKAEEGIATLAAEIKALEAGIKALDKSVADASAQRKDEHDDVTELLAADSTAKDLLNFAKNRLNKFYSPKMYKAAPKRELSSAERTTVNLGGEADPTPAPGGIAGTGIGLVQVSRHTQKDAPAPPPETFDAYTKKSAENTGVISMISLLIKDLDKDMAEAQTQEALSQKDYEVMMADSASKRANDSKSLTQKNSAKAGLEGDLEAHKEAKAATNQELMAATKLIAALHGECDWLLQYYDVRKEARAGEVDSLKSAKAVLSGADFAL